MYRQQRRRRQRCPRSLRPPRCSRHSRFRYRQARNSSSSPRCCTPRFESSPPGIREGLEPLARWREERGVDRGRARLARQLHLYRFLRTNVRHPIMSSAHNAGAEHNSSRKKNDNRTSHPAWSWSSSRKRSRRDEYSSGISLMGRLEHTTAPPAEAPASPAAAPLEAAASAVPPAPPRCCCCAAPPSASDAPARRPVRSAAAADCCCCCAGTTPAPLSTKCGPAPTAPPRAACSPEKSAPSRTSSSSTLESPSSTTASETTSRRPAPPASSRTNASRRRNAPGSIVHVTVVCAGMKSQRRRQQGRSAFLRSDSLYHLSEETHTRPPGRRARNATRSAGWLQAGAHSRALRASCPPARSAPPAARGGPAAPSRASGEPARGKARAQRVW